MKNRGARRANSTSDCARCRAGGGSRTRVTARWREVPAEVRLLAEGGAKNLVVSGGDASGSGGFARPVGKRNNGVEDTSEVSASEAEEEKDRREQCHFEQGLATLR